MTRKVMSKTLKRPWIAIQRTNRILLADRKKSRRKNFLRRSPARSWLLQRRTSTGGRHTDVKIKFFRRKIEARS